MKYLKVYEMVWLHIQVIGQESLMRVHKWSRGYVRTAEF